MKLSEVGDGPPAKDIKAPKVRQRAGRGEEEERGASSHEVAGDEGEKDRSAEKSEYNEEGKCEPLSAPAS